MGHDIIRERLISRIKQELCDSSIVFIVAPSGYGKSAVVEQYAQSIRTPIINIQLNRDLYDKSDAYNEINRVIAGALAGISDSNLARTGESVARRSARNEAVKTIIIDNYERVKSKEYVVEMTKEICASKLANKVIIISRGNTFFPTKELVYKKIASVITTEDLAFSREEVDELSWLYKHSLSIPEKEYLNEVLQGCPQLVRAYFDKKLSFGQKAQEMLYINTINNLDSMVKKNIAILCALETFDYAEACEIIGGIDADKVIEDSRVYDDYLLYSDKSHEYRFNEYVRMATEDVPLGRA